MLILTRRVGQSLMIGETILVRIVEVKGHHVRIGIEAPAEIKVWRREVYERILQERSGP